MSETEDIYEEIFNEMVYRFLLLCTFSPDDVILASAVAGVVIVSYW